MEKTILPDKKYYTAQVLMTLIISILIIIIAFIVNLIIYKAAPDQKAITVIWYIAAAGIIVMWLIVYPITYLWIKNLEYNIMDDRVTINKGIFIKNQQNIPYRSITDFVLRRGPIDRLLGIGSILIQTAGQSVSASGYEGTLSGLLEFDTLHKELREKVKSLHPVSESITTAEAVSGSETDILRQILSELRNIREKMEK